MSDTSISNGLTRRECLLGVCALGTGIDGCATSRVQKASSPTTASASTKLHLDKLATAAGMMWFVSLRPKPFWKHPILGPLVVRYIPAHRRKVTKRLYGFDPANVTATLGVGYRRSRMWLLDGLGDSSSVERMFRTRLRGVVAGKNSNKTIHWLEGHALDGQLRGFAKLGNHAVAMETGGGVHVKASALYAVGKLSKVPTLSNSPLVATVDHYLGDAPLRAIAWGPFDGKWASSLDGMLAAATSVGAAIRPSPNGDLALRVVILGAWGRQASEAEKHASSSWLRLTRSHLGHLLALHEPKLQPRLWSDEQCVRFDVVLDGRKVLLGLYKAVRGSLADIMRDGT